MRTFFLLCIFASVEAILVAKETPRAQRIIELCNDYNVCETRKLKAKLKDVDALLFESPVAVEKEEQSQKLVTDVDAIKEWISVLRVEVDPSKCELGDNGEFMVPDSFCQCWGDFAVSAFSGGKLIGRFSVFHHRYIHDAIFTKGSSIYLSQESFDYLYSMASFLEKQKEAQPPKTSSTTAIPAAK